MLIINATGRHGVQYFAGFWLIGSREVEISSATIMQKATIGVVGLFSDECQVRQSPPIATM